jgi:hypothetical protein
MSGAFIGWTASNISWYFVAGETELLEFELHCE